MTRTSKDTSHPKQSVRAPQFGRRAIKSSPGAQSPMPQIGDVVLCYFPEDERPSQPGPKVRPALVMMNGHNRNGEPMLALAYGTSRKMDDEWIKPNDLILSDPEALIACGLRRTTKFDLDRVRVIPWKRHYFSWTRDGRCVLGRISDEIAKGVHSILSQIAERQRRQAYADEKAIKAVDKWLARMRAADKIVVSEQHTHQA